MSSPSSISAGGGQPGRPRFSSAPSETSRTPWPPPQFSNSVWGRLEEVGRFIREKIRSAVINYAPGSCQSPALEKVDILSKRVQDTLNEENRSRISDLCSSKISSIGNTLSCPRSVIISILSILLFIFSLPLQYLVITLTLELVLPFYATFKCVYWYVSFRRTFTNRLISNTQPTVKHLNYWWIGAITIDCLILIIDWTTGPSENDCSLIIGIVLHYGVPLIIFIGAKLYLDTNWTKHKDTSPDEDDTEESSYSWLLEYFLLTCIVRYSAIIAFTLLPQSLKPFLGYAACYCAAVEAYKEPSKSNAADSTDSEQVAPTSALSGLATLSTSRPASVPQILAPQSPSFRPRFHLSDSDSALKAMTTPGGRGSRRVSLPAGSLLPLKAAQSNLSEARGMLADMLAQKELPPAVVAGLKAVSGLLVPGCSSQATLTSQLDFLGSIPRVMDSPYIGGDVSLASVETAAQRRQSPSVVWSTTTSATGLPTLEPEPSRSRSSSYWKQRHQTDNDDDKGALQRQSIDLPSKLLQIADGTLYDLTEIGRDPYLTRLKEWSLPVFDLYSDAPETILSRTAYTVFQRSGLFRIFKINKQKFMSFFHALEKGYRDLPYHNRIHATDVLHATYYLTCHKVPAFSGITKCNYTLGSIGEDDENSDLENEEYEPRGSMDSSRSRSGSSQLDEQSGTLASVLSSLELLGLYTAAAMHDFDHPGRTNAFLVAIQDPKAILYNDRSVLENHHAAAAWQLLTKSENNFIEQLDAAEYKRLRYSVIEAILATDLKRHFEILMDFNGKVAKGLDWDNEADKLLTSQICIKMADINSPTKPGALHKEWTDRILEEFYAQGDEEKERGLPVSPYMDRHDAQLARLQDSFIAHLVAPLAMAMNDAGLLPLIASDTDNAESSASAGSKSELLMNLEVNHKHWKVELGEDPASAVQAVPHAGSAGKGSSPMAKEEDEMAIIEEQEDESGNGDE